MAVEISDAAVDRVKQLKGEGKIPEDSFVRVGVKGGGCAGFSYVIDFDSKRRLSDHTFKKDGVTVVVDPKSYPFLNGMTLDYEKSLMGQSFVFKNPNAKSSCGCGLSFGV